MSGALKSTLPGPREGSSILNVDLVVVTAAVHPVTDLVVVAAVRPAPRAAVVAAVRPASPTAIGWVNIASLCLLAKSGSPLTKHRERLFAC